MSQVADPTFSQEILGKGVAVIPSEGRIVAPASGEVVVMFETKHAVSIKADNGAELIVHIGLDTVNLKGEYFEAVSYTHLDVYKRQIMGITMNETLTNESDRSKQNPAFCIQTRQSYTSRNIKITGNFSTSCSHRRSAQVPLIL